MKKILLIMALVAGILSASARDNYSHDENILPVAARTTIKNNFKASINHIKIDKEWGSIAEYEVVLNDGTEISFDKNGNWKDIEVKISSTVPSSLVPVSISNYVKQHQNKTRIVGIEKKRSGYDVELSNGVEMKFNTEGKFLRYDD